MNRVEVEHFGFDEFAVGRLRREQEAQDLLSRTSLWCGARLLARSMSRWENR
jgi:hypothetical protein